jgi:glutamine amidotransferase
METVIIDYNAGNTRSLIFALNRLGIDPVLTADPERIKKAGRVFLPGVGHAASAMEELRKRRLDILIPKLENPFLGICLGQQLLCSHSDEGNTACLGVFNVPVKLFPPGMKVPHMGWNNITNLEGELFRGVAEGSFAYHVHSYFVPLNPAAIATCEYQLPFATAIKQGNFYGVQFHPEKSGDTGSLILQNFLDIV